MTKKVSCIMLIDDNEDDNFYHARVIKKAGVAEKIVVKDSGLDALEYLKANLDANYILPDLIFLDINMPSLNGWEFLEEYNKLAPNLQSKVVIVMLTTSDNPDDIEKAKQKGQLSDFKTKPLTKELLFEVIEANF